MTDAIGRIVLMKRINASGPSFFNERVDLSGLASGSYSSMLRHDNGSQHVQKLIVD